MQVEFVTRNEEQTSPANVETTFAELTIPENGKYLIISKVRYYGNTVNSIFASNLYKNSTLLSNDTLSQIAISGTYWRQLVTQPYVVDASKNDKIYIKGSPSSGVLRCSGVVLLAVRVG